MAERKSVPKESDAGSAMKAVLLIGVVIMAVILIVGGIYLTEHLRHDEPESSPKSENKYFGDLLEDDGAESYVIEDIDFDGITLDEAFGYFDTKDKFYLEAKVTFTSPNGEKTERIKRITRNGDKYNIRTYNKFNLLETIRCDGQNILIINETTGESTIINAKGHSLFTLSGLPDHKEVLKLTAEYKNADDKSKCTLSSCEYSLSRGKEENTLTLNLTYRDTGVQEEYLYYLDSGIIYSLTSKAVGNKNKMYEYYSASTTFFTPDISGYVQEDSFKASK
ncbi:MAG: hypothetical protein U0M06_08090 [Clostridia bacterium]|nr:hypothetical protein [Clostridia bacterium]